MEDTRIHPETGETLMRQVRTQRVTFGSLSRDVAVPGWYPEGEGDSLHLGKDLAEKEAVYQQLRKDYGARVRMIRKMLKLTQEGAGQIVGGGRRAFQKYEAGIMAPSVAAIGLLEVLAQNPQTLSILRQVKSNAGGTKESTAKPA